MQKKSYRSRHKKRKIDSQIHAKLSAGPLGNQSSPKIGIQKMKEKVNVPAKEENANEQTKSYVLPLSRRSSILFGEEAT